MRALRALALSAACASLAAPARAETPRVYAHRGATQTAPENTLAACAAAFALGASCEVDVRATRDGELVLMHDASVGRTTYGQGRVAALALAELRALALRRSASERVPTLEEALTLPRAGQALLLDLKQTDAPFHARLARLLSSARGEVVLGVRSEVQARALRRALPALEQVALIGGPHQIEALAAAGAETIRLEGAWLARAPGLAARVRAAGPRLLVLVPGADTRDLRAALAHAPAALLSDDPAAALALAREANP